MLFPFAVVDGGGGPGRREPDHRQRGDPMLKKTLLGISGVNRVNLTSDNRRELMSMSLLIAAIMVAMLPSFSSAQKIELPPRVFAAPGEPSPTISCAASSDLTGHMICAEIVNGLLYGVSWHTPPGDRPGEVGPLPVGPGEVDELPPVPALGGRSISCAAAIGRNGDPSGTVICAMASGRTLYGYALSPENHTSTELIRLGTAPTPFSTAPSCASVLGVANGPIICAITAGSKLYGIQFDPRPGSDFFNSGIQEALPEENLVIDGAGPACAAITIQGAAECAVTLTGGGLAAVAFDLKNLHKVVHLGRPAHSTGISAVSCAAGPPAGIGCAVLGKTDRPDGHDKPDERGDSNLFIIASDPQSTSPSFVSTGFKQIPGVRSGRNVSCAGSNDPDMSNAVSCAVEIPEESISFSKMPSAIKGLKFDSVTLSTSGLQRTVFLRPFNRTAMSCISLFIDQNQISCGIATTAGSFGVDLTFAQNMD